MSPIHNKYLGSHLSFSAQTKGGGGDRKCLFYLFLLSSSVAIFSRGENFPTWICLKKSQMRKKCFFHSFCCSSSRNTPVETRHTTPKLYFKWKRSSYFLLCNWLSIWWKFASHLNFGSTGESPLFESFTTSGYRSIKIEKQEKQQFLGKIILTGSL